jgi:hypothetical protein
MGAWVNISESWYYTCAVGSELANQSQKMTVAASATAENKTVGHR